MSTWKRLVNSRSRSFAIVVFAFCIGIGVGPAFLFLQFDYVLAAAILLLAIAFIISSKSARVGLLIVIALLVGISRYGQSFPPTEARTVADEVGAAVRVSGIVNAEVEQKINSQRIVINEVRVADAPVAGKVLIRFDQQPRIHHGDLLTFSCRLKAPEPIESFAYDRYLASRGILAICYRPEYMDVVPSDEISIVGAVLSVKEKIVGRLALIIPEPHAAFLSGLLFGGSSSLSSDLKDDFSRTGTSHILAASGFNVSLFTAVFLGWILGTRLGRKRSLYVTSALLVIFVIMAGATPAVIRAAIMASLLLVGIAIRRKASMLNIVILTAAIMLAVNPLILLDDVGFQLSFAATMALIFVAKKWDKPFSFIPESFGLRESFVGSLAAIILTLPIVLWHFGSISIVAPIINLLILPLIPYVMALMMISLAVSFVSLQAGTLVALPAWAISSVMLHLIGWFAALPYASIASEHASVIAVIVGTVMVIIYLIVKNKQYVRSDLAR